MPRLVKSTAFLLMLPRLPSCRGLKHGPSFHTIQNFQASWEGRAFHTWLFPHKGKLLRNKVWPFFFPHFLELRNSMGREGTLCRSFPHGAWTVVYLLLTLSRAFKWHRKGGCSTPGPFPPERKRPVMGQHIIPKTATQHFIFSAGRGGGGVEQCPRLLSRLAPRETT